MSARNYKECPCCRTRETRLASERWQIARDAYGKVPEERYRELMEDAGTERHLEETLAEYYELGVYRCIGPSVEFTMRYNCHCDVCGYSFETKCKVDAANQSFTKAQEREESNHA